MANSRTEVSESTIKSMQLYSHVDRIYNDLREAGIKPTDPLSVDMLVPFDQLHYFGVDAVDEAIQSANIGKQNRILDVGSGLGGPARYLANKTGCQVTAVELQSDMDEVARSLTQRCGLDGQIQHICADIHEASIPSSSIDAVVSWLAVYHIPDHQALYSRLHESMKAGGRLYLEDLYGDGEFNATEQQEVNELLYGEHLQSKQEYVSDLESAGFMEIQFEDMTDRWQPFVAERLQQFRANREDKVRVHGENVVRALDGFYEVVARLLEGGKLRGTRVTATATQD